MGFPELGVRVKVVERESCSSYDENDDLDPATIDALLVGRFKDEKAFAPVEEVRLDLRIPEPRCLFCYDGDALDEPHVCELTKLAPLASKIREDTIGGPVAYLMCRGERLLAASNLEIEAFGVGANVWRGLVSALYQPTGKIGTMLIAGRSVHQLRPGFHPNMVVPLTEATYQVALVEAASGGALRFWDAATVVGADTNDNPCPWCTYGTRGHHRCKATLVEGACVIGRPSIRQALEFASRTIGGATALALGSQLYRETRLVPEQFEGTSIARLPVHQLRDDFHARLVIPLGAAAYADAKRMAREQATTRFWDEDAKAPEKVVGYRDGALSINGTAFPLTPPIVAAPPRPQYDVPLTINGKASGSISFEANPRVWQRAVDAAYCPPDLNRDAFRAVLIGMPESHMSLSTAEASIAWTIAAIQQRRDCDVYRRYCRALAAPRPPAGPWLARRSARR